MTVVAPYSTSYLQSTPYITVAEFEAAPTGLDLSQLVAGGSGASQTEAVAELIAGASSLVDQHCTGAAWGSITATQNTENNRIRLDRKGVWHVNTKFFPVIAVSAFSVGATPGEMEAIPLTSENCWIEERGFAVYDSGLPMTTIQGAPLQLGPPTRPGDEALGQWTYVNGWPNTLLSGPVAAGASDISLVNLTGIFPGTQLTIWDAPDDEPIVVSSTWGGTNPVTLANPVLNAHASGVSVSALPRTVKLATILIASALVKRRGGGNYIVLGDGTKGTATTSVQGDLQNRRGDLADAYDWLEPFCMR